MFLKEDAGDSQEGGFVEVNAPSLCCHVVWPGVIRLSRASTLGGDSGARREARRLASWVTPHAYNLLQTSDAAGAVDAICGADLPPGGYTSK